MLDARSRPGTHVIRYVERPDSIHDATRTLLSRSSCRTARAASGSSSLSGASSSTASPAPSSTPASSPRSSSSGAADAACGPRQSRRAAASSRCAPSTSQVIPRRSSARRPAGPSAASTASAPRCPRVPPCGDSAGRALLHRHHEAQRQRRAHPRPHAPSSSAPASLAYGWVRASQALPLVKNSY